MKPEGTVITEWEDCDELDGAKGYNEAMGDGGRHQAHLTLKAFQYDQKLPVVKYRETILRSVLSSLKVCAMDTSLEITTLELASVISQASADFFSIRSQLAFVPIF